MRRRTRNAEYGPASWRRVDLVACPHCQRATEAGGRFCTQCGQAMPMAGPPGSMVPQQGTGQSNGLSLAAMVVGLVSFVFAAPISSIVAIVLASMALNRGAQGTDRTYALVGLWTGIGSMAIMVAMLLFFISLDHWWWI